MFVPKASLAWRIYRRIIRTRVEFFSVPAIIPRADVLKLCDLPASFPGFPNVDRPTILIDLRASEDDLWNTLDAQTRKLIRQAIRHGVVVQRIPELTEDIWNAFLAAFWKLRRRKQNAGALGVGQISELIEQGRFVLSTSRDAQGNVLSWHSYVRTPDRVRLLNTISDLDPSRDTGWNNLVGRAHRVHHWRDMLDFKHEGVHTYDFGGVYRGTEDQEQINIARFKQLFGGSFADTYDAVVPLTLKGRLALSLVSRIGAEARAGGRAVGATA
jgi:hypothetical protein